MRKIYSTGYNELQLDIPLGNIKVHVRFHGGRAVQGVRAQLITSDPLVQTALESDPRFGKMWRLDKTIKEKGDVAPKAKTDEVKTTVVEDVHDLTDAIDYFATLGKTARSEKAVHKLMEEYHVEFPNLKA